MGTVPLCPDSAGVPLIWDQPRRGPDTRQRQRSALGGKGCPRAGGPACLGFPFSPCGAAAGAPQGCDPAGVPGDPSGK